MIEEICQALARELSHLGKFYTSSISSYIHEFSRILLQDLIGDKNEDCH